jgi:hypothetical protein
VKISDLKISEALYFPARQRVTLSTHDQMQANKWLNTIQKHIFDEELRNKPRDFEFGHVTLHNVILCESRFDQDPGYHFHHTSPKVEIEIVFIPCLVEKDVEKINLLELMYEDSRD